ncbi:MAG: putative cell division protein YtgP [Candidatus Nitrosocaldaceae archaeon]|nr:MAG: putative cell division protein YtgP [Candidatus Nitrosocaldaceae archaeon]
MRLGIMDNRDRLVKGSFYMMLDNVTNIVVGALFWIVMAKLVEPNILGQVMVAVALATTVIGFTGSGTNIMISKYVAEFNAKKMLHNSRRVLIIGLRLALAVSGAVTLLIILLASNIAENVYKDPSIAPFLIFSAIGFIPSQTIQMALKGAFEGAQKMKHSLFITIIFQGVRLASAIVLVIYGLSGLGIIAGFAAGTSIAAIVGYYLIHKIIPKSKEKYDELKRTLKFSGLNYINVGMRMSTLQIGVMVLGTQNFEFAAFYGLATIISRIVGGLNFAISRALLPTISAEYALGSKDKIQNMFNTSVRMSLILSGFVLIVLFLKPSYVLSLLSESYIQASLALRILVISALLNSLGMIVLSVLNAANKPHNVAYAGVISSIVAIALTFVLAPFFSLEGAALAMLIGSIILTILSLYLLKKEEGIVLKIKNAARPIGSIAVAIAIGFFISYLFDNALLVLTIALITHALLSFGFRATNKNEIKSLLNTLVKRA